MIDRREAEQIAAQWAHRESLRRGYECAPMVAEFDLGYVVWTSEAAAALPVPGEGTRTVIDRETGRVSSWPGLPPTVVQQMYRQRRESIVTPVRTADPAVELRRNARRRPTPAAAAHITLADRQVIGRGAKGDQELRHHPLVQDYLDDLPPGHLVRGGDRHAELVALSDLLHAEDARRAEEAGRGGGGAPPMAPDDVRRLVAGAAIEVFRVREPGDPVGGQPVRPCESCINALVYFGLLEWPHLAYVEEWRPAGGPDPQPGRFPPEVAAVLAAGGWRVSEVDHMLAEAWTGEVLAVPGAEHRHVDLPAARQAMTGLVGAVAGRRGPGLAHWIRVFEINPVAAAHSADILADFGTLIGARLFPLGTEGDNDSILAIDEHGRVFALDQAGEWFLGATADAAVVALVTGQRAARVRDDGTW